MWLNAFYEGGKPISPVELLVLATVPSEPESPKSIINRLGESELEWFPAAGTLYPILHRLVKRGLLQKIGSTRFKFGKTKSGNIFLSSNLRALRSQIKESLSYNLVLLESILKLDPSPIDLKLFLSEIEGYVSKFVAQFNTLKQESEDIIDSSFNVPITFD